MSKHTPGPWKVKGHMIGTDANPNSIALAYKRDYTTTFNGQYKEDVEQNSNAKLIAAAPELLEALRAIVLEDELDLVACFKNWQTAKAVILKATS